MSEHLTPERLSAIRSLYVATRNGYPALMTAESGELLAHIDAQAENIEECDNILSKQSRILTDTANALKGKPEPLTTHSHHDLAKVAEDLAAHQAEVLEPLIAAREHEAWKQGVKTALNHAIDNDDGITLRLEHLDGRPWENPYGTRADSD